MLRLIAITMGALAAAACAPGGERSLLDRHTEALGGAAAIEAVEAVRIEVDIVEPEFALLGDYRATRDGRMRIDIHADGTRVFTEALNGETGWQMFGDGTVADLSEAGDAALRRGVANNLYGLHEFAELGHAVTEGPDVEIDGAPYHTLDIVYADGFETRLYLDPETLLVERKRAEFALHPDLDPEAQRLEEILDDYREVDGVMRAFRTRQIDMETGEVVQTATLRAIEINPGLDPAQFEQPDD